MLPPALLPRTLGLEIEAVVGYLGQGGNRHIQDALASIFNANDLSAVSRAYCSLPVTTDIAVEYDSSLRFDSCPYRGLPIASIEVKTRIMNWQDYERIVPATLSMLRFCGARVTATTGLHVNLGVPEMKRDPRIAKRIYNVFSRWQYVLYGLTAPGRRSNNHCTPLPNTADFLRAHRSRASSTSTRYCCVNFAHLWDEQPRLEIRLFSSSLNPTKVRHLTRLSSRLIDCAVLRGVHGTEPLPNDAKSLDRFLIACGFKINNRICPKLSDELRSTGRWIRKRWRQMRHK